MPKRLPLAVLVPVLIGAVVFSYFIPAHHRPFDWWAEGVSVLLIWQMVCRGMVERKKGR